eukprot:TRINITY_DN2528_c2_g1_i1.p1 TRINITY_DN2528_c2_g1~~TRINITY_DN2528_c2_g1_i1.p1  ORF type:complete len:541 (+),score=91.05 TRINITY_DN2528_c2_g1_i1:1279-2901(+)
MHSCKYFSSTDNKKVGIVEETKENPDKENLELILNVLEDAVLKASLILETFNAHERFSEITTYHKETFDLLWKTCKIIKPIVAAFIPSQEAFLFDSTFALGKADKNFLVVKCGAKETMLELTEILLENVKTSDKYKEIAGKLLKRYETIISNLVGYADALPFMKNYNSKVSLFKYAISLAHEASVLESSSKGNEKAALKYSQAELVIDLILRDVFEKENINFMETDALKYEVMNEDKNKRWESEGLNNEVESTLSVSLVSEAEIRYIRKIKHELYNKCKEQNNNQLILLLFISLNKQVHTLEAQQQILYTTQKMAEKKHTPKEELTKMLTERIAKAEVYLIFQPLSQAAVEAAKEKLEEYKNAHVTAKKLLYEKLEELKALASEEEVKIKTQVKEKMEDSVVRIGEEIEVAQKSLKEKQALLKERDFMIQYLQHITAKHSELEGRYHKKCVKNKGRYNIKEGYLLELEKLNDEFQKVAKENETLKTDKESKESRVLELQSQIREMNDLLRSLSIAKEGLNKYVENSKFVLMQFIAKRQEN